MGEHAQAAADEANGPGGVVARAATADDTGESVHLGGQTWSRVPAREPRQGVGHACKAVDAGPALPGTLVGEVGGDVCALRQTAGRGGQCDQDARSR
jgi:hypothetical protein